MYWFLDNANLWYVLFGIVGLGFGAAWWVHRRPKLLIGVAVGVNIIALIWLLNYFVVTDQRQINLIVREMADAAVDGKAEVFLKHLAKDFEFQGHKRSEVVEKIKPFKKYQIYDIYISSFEVEELKDNMAKVYFRATVRSRMDERPLMIAFRCLFIKEDGQWKLKEAVRYNPVTNEKILAPID